MSYARFAIYYLPPAGPLADFGAAWSGWDIARGCVTRQLDLPDLADVTAAPGKYGLHGTLKPPFRLAAGQTCEGLQAATAALAGQLEPVTCEGLELSVLDRFLALTPTGDPAALQRLTAACVRQLDRFRAPARPAELAKRRKVGLSARQDALLMRWGYPYVMEDFRFHLTLIGQVPKAGLAVWQTCLASHLPPLPRPFVLDQIALCGERADGRFELIDRYGLRG